MNTMLKIAVIATALSLMLLADVPLLPVPLVPEAHAILGVRRRSFVVGASVGAAAAGSATRSQQAATSQQQAATSQQQAATAQQQAATAQQQSATAQQQAAAAAAGKPLPLGTVVATLPPGCTSTPVGGVEYYYCGGNFYRAAFQGNSLVYVTAQPK
jgi:glucose/arabinose dehydrogenase